MFRRRQQYLTASNCRSIFVFFVACCFVLSSAFVSLSSRRRLLPTRQPFVRPDKRFFLERTRATRTPSTSFESDVALSAGDEISSTSDAHSDDASQSSVEASENRSPRNSRYYQQTIDVYRNSAHRDEKERRELEWVVRNSGKILGPDAPAPGTMTVQQIELVIALMRAWARRSSKRESRAPHVVERLLQRLLQERDAGNQKVSIDTPLYNTVLDAWSNSNELGSAERTEEILSRLEKMYRSGNDNVKPNEHSYNAVIKAYVKNGDRRTSAAKVEAIIDRMEKNEELLGDNEDKPSLSLDSLDTDTITTSTATATARPNRRSYNLLLYALANNPSLKDAPMRADRILQKMIKRYMVTRNEMDKPGVNSFNQAIGAWVRVQPDGFESKMEETYQQLLNLPEDFGDVQPDSDTFNAVLGGWLKSDRHDALAKIGEVIQVMEESYENGNEAAKPNRITINTLMAAFSKDGSSGDALKQAIEVCRTMEAKYQIQADQISHNIVVDNWCKSGRPDAPERVIEFLERMENRFKRDGKLKDKPDGYTYSSVIGCFVKYQRPDAAQYAEELVKRMHDLHENYGGNPVTTSVYNALLNAWASSDSEHATARVRQILQKMEEDDPNIPVADRITYNTVIKALGCGEDGDAEFAETILDTLEQKGQENPDLLPDSYSYAAVINAYSHSDSVDKAEKVLKVLYRQIDANKKYGELADNRPNIHSFNAALNSCAFFRHSGDPADRAFEIAMQLYDMMVERNVRPDATTYGCMLRIISTLLPRNNPEREELVEKFFKLACDDGCVGRLVIAQMKYAATPDQHFRLLGFDIVERINPGDLPKSWTRNVKKDRQRQRQQQQTNDGENS